jgi:hypothetical protein
MTAFNHAWKSPQMGSTAKEAHAVKGNGKIELERCKGGSRNFFTGDSVNRTKESRFL